MLYAQTNQNALISLASLSYVLAILLSFLLTKFAAAERINFSKKLSSAEGIARNKSAPEMRIREVEVESSSQVRPFCLWGLVRAWLAREPSRIFILNFLPVRFHPPLFFVPLFSPAFLRWQKKNKKSNFSAWIWHFWPRTLPRNGKDEEVN